MNNSAKLARSYTIYNQYHRALSLVCACCLFLALTTACTGQGVTNPKEEQEMTSPEDSAANSVYAVGVYYYPWYGGNFHGGRYMREHLRPPQLPGLGEYDDRAPEVIAQHLEWSRAANVSLWVSRMRSRRAA